MQASQDAVSRPDQVQGWLPVHQAGGTWLTSTGLRENLWSKQRSKVLDMLPFTSPAASSRFSLAMKSHLRWNGSAGFPSLGIEETVRNKFIVSNKTRTRVFLFSFQSRCARVWMDIFQKKKKTSMQASKTRQAGRKSLTRPQWRAPP